MICLSHFYEVEEERDESLIFKSSSQDKIDFFVNLLLQERVINFKL